MKTERCARTIHLNRNALVAKHPRIPILEVAPIEIILAGHALPLTKNEEARLARCEGLLRLGLNAVFDAGNALIEIRKGCLYRATHKTFAAYCYERWGIGRTYGWRLMGAARRIKLLPFDNETLRPESESHVRPFLKLEPEEFPSAWERVCKRAKNGRITAELARQVVAEICAERGLGSVRRRQPLSRVTIHPGRLLSLLLDVKRKLQERNFDAALAALDGIEWELFPR